MSKAFRNASIVTVGCLLAVAALLLARWLPSKDQKILSALYEQRPARGRLFRATQPESNGPDEALLAQAQVHALAVSDPARRDRIQSLIDTATGRWPEAIETLTRLNDASRGDPELLNDLAMATAALAPENAVNYFKALELLREARKAAPSAPAPLFNTLRIYRSLGLKPPDEETLAQYNRLEKNPAWLTELKAPPSREEPHLLDDLRNAVKGGDEERISRLFEENFDHYRHVATDYAMIPESHDGSDPVMRYIAEKIRSSRHDETLAAMLEPLRTSNRPVIVDARKMVRAGAAAYRAGRFQESFEQYDLAAAKLQGIESPFDRLWIDLNRGDIHIRVGQIDRARSYLDPVVMESRKRHYPWLLGQALAALGSNAQLTQDFLATENALAESIDVLNGVGASEYTARPLYYLALWRLIGGDVEGSLNLALQSMRLTKAEDHTRMTQVYWLMARSLRRLNFSEHAIGFLRLAVREAEATDSPMMVASTTLDLAAMYQVNLDYNEAERHFSRALNMRDKLNAREQLIFGYSADILCGRIQLGRKNPREAAACLERNIDNLHKEQQPLLVYLAPSLTLLAQAEIMLGDVERARELLHRATNVVEGDDDYLVTERSRLPFDNERRDLYESAILFEYDHNGQDAAWSYVQRYRSKLFLEFLGQVNPAVARAHSEAIRRDTVQKRIPPGVQVLEYFVLKNQLLIWVVSSDRFLAEMFPIDRESLEGKVNKLILQIRKKENVDKLLSELYDVLIAPVEGRLDPRRAIVVVPDQTLHRLPFGALRHGPSGKYFIEKHAILESPNLTTLLATSGVAPERNFVVSYGSRGEGAPFGAEALSLDDFYANTANVALDATKGKFLADLSRASILHYSGHSIDAPDPLNAAILLDGESNGPNRVIAAEISRRRMRQNAVVILASCDSSLGNARDGVGLRGLTSAFLIAGAGTVAGSLWPVEDVSTSSLMRSFHSGFSMKISAAEAMRRAQTSFLEHNPRMSHPYYWSGFVVNGNLSALQ